MEVKKVVKERYGQIARQSGGCCGGSAQQSCGAGGVANAIGYSAQDLASTPDGANLGLGCGNPLGLAEIRPGDTVLDLGSGAGFDCFLAAARVGPAGKVIGIDMTEEMIAKARANAAQGGFANVEFRLGEIENLPVENEAIDQVISNCVLNLVPDKARAFREIARVLKPGGRIMISDILLRGELPAEIKASLDAYAACIGGAMEADEYLAAMGAAGLAEAEILSEVDAAALFAVSTDCGCSSPELQSVVELLRGKIVSASVRARKA